MEKLKTCPICEKRATDPVKSHLMPQWVTKRHLGQKEDSLQEINFSTNKIYIPKNKRGIFRKYLLCQNCESNIATLDGYASLFFKNTVNRNNKPEKKHPYPGSPFPALAFTFNVSKIRKFIISVILRYYYFAKHYDTNNYFKYLLKVPIEHIEYLRKLFNSQDSNHSDKNHSTTISYFFDMKEGYKYSYTDPTIGIVCKMDSIVFNIGEYHFIQFVSSHISPEFKKELPNTLSTLENRNDRFMCYPAHFSNYKNFGSAFNS